MLKSFDLEIEKHHSDVTRIVSTKFQLTILKKEGEMHCFWEENKIFFLASF